MPAFLLEFFQRDPLNPIFELQLHGLLTSALNIENTCLTCFLPPFILLSLPPCTSSIPLLPPPTTSFL